MNTPIFVSGVVSFQYTVHIIHIMHRCPSFFGNDLEGFIPGYAILRIVVPLIYLDAFREIFSIGIIRGIVAVPQFFRAIADG